ncbi:hypothetical protein SAMN03159488_02289 [Pseudomonas sp. NFIX10]|nr:hypothetical protein SAMN03159488_02289 [Pseudomonas sp. NFIX10]SFE79548.1 hypothetical protein SAMN03159367_02106 [Pseudomonas sp. NFACC06-1]
MVIDQLPTNFFSSISYPKGLPQNCNNYYSRFFICFERKVIGEDALYITAQLIVKASQHSSVMRMQQLKEIIGSELTARNSIVQVT